jgi:hypothetical protein
VRCSKCGIDHSPAIGCKQALTLSGNHVATSGLPSARPRAVALSRCQVCRRLHAPHCGAAQAVPVAGAQPARDGLGYDWADAQLGLASPAQPPEPATPKARRPRKAPHAGETAAAPGDYMRQQQETRPAGPTPPPADPVAPVTETGQNGSNPEKTETTGAEVTPKQRPMTNAERQAAYRARHRKAVNTIDRERKRAQKGKTA